VKKYILIVLLIITVKCFGQNSFIGLMAGVNASTIVPNKNFDNPGFRIGISGGVGYQHVFQSGLLAGIDMLYDQRGFTTAERYGSISGGYITWQDTKGKSLGEWLITKYHYNYLSMPFMAGYQFGSKLCFSICGGVKPSLRLSAKIVEPDNIFTSGPTVIEWVKSDLRWTTKRLSLAGFAEMEMDYNLKNNFWITGSLTYQHDFAGIDKVNYSGNAGNNYSYKYNIILHGMSLKAGVKWTIKKKEKPE
jgi:hypothetical protein